uniref:Uncharacterized protein n=1 Tax=viral metagenome TaxID=1070528 RepID=A0A6C0HA46_9ZZZZ
MIILLTSFITQIISFNNNFIIILNNKAFFTSYNKLNKNIYY